MATALVRWLVLGLLAATASGQAVQQCPGQGEITPCVCSVKKNGLDIMCEFTDFTHITKALGVLKKKPNMVIFYLKLRHNNLPKLQSFVFLGMDIRHLTVHNSTLAVIEESSLSSMGKGLTQLDLSQNLLNSVPSTAFRNLHHLLILNLNHNKIIALHTKAFEGLDTLEILTLYENKITSIDPEAFKGLEKKLKRLNLGGNDLHSVPQAALSILDNLRKLEIHENSISIITEGDFEGLSNLDSLGLAYNHLREVPARVFSHLKLLNSLELEGNAIARIDDEAFVGLEENLQYLRLGDNNLHSIPSNALRKLHRLRHLDLRANNISVVSEDAFSLFGDSITFLNLQKNSLGDNNLHSIPSNALRKLHRLRHLDLRANNISVVSEDAFSLFGDSITFLNLQKNSIKVLPALVFENLNSLEILNLQNNKLKHMPEELMEPIVDTLRVVDIMDNPLICDCQLRWYKDWLKNLKDKDDDFMQKKNTLCTMIQEHREYTVQNIPLDRMNCIGKNIMGRSSQTTGNSIKTQPESIIKIGFAICNLIYWVY